MSGKWVEFEDVKVLKSTANAGQFQFPDGYKLWIPWSQISKESVDRDGATGTLICTVWIAEKKGLI